MLGQNSKNLFILGGYKNKKICFQNLLTFTKPLKTASVDDVAFVARRPKGALAFKALPSEHHFALDGRKRPCIGRVCGLRKEVFQIGQTLPV